MADNFGGNGLGGFLNSIFCPKQYPDNSPESSTTCASQGDPFIDQLLSGKVTEAVVAFALLSGALSVQSLYVNVGQPYQILLVYNPPNETPLQQEEQEEQMTTPSPPVNR